MSIKLGDTVEDKVSHYYGIVIGITQWLYAESQVCVQSHEIFNGRVVEEWFAEGRLSITGESGHPVPEENMEPVNKMENKPDVVQIC
jgi:hypothetical protein